MIDETKNRLYLTLAFALGVALTLGYKDVYPDLEHYFNVRRRRQQSVRQRRFSTYISDQWAGWRGIKLEDHTSESSAVEDGDTNGALRPSSLLAQSPENSSQENLGGVVSGIEGAIGNTPLLQIKSLSSLTGCTILAKAEFLNGAGGSPKDRVALNIINRAEEEGLLVPHRGDVVYEGTVGSTGISLAAICRARGYTAHICMPDDQAREKSDVLEKLGATVERVRPASIVDQKQFVNAARHRAREHTESTTRPGRGLFADQFENEANWRAHFEGTGPEIYRQAEGQIDAFVAGAGTGGTISGVALFLKPQIPDIKIVLADPHGSGLYNRVKFGVMFASTEREGTRRRHQVDSIVEGIGINRVTANFEAGRELIDDAIRVSDEQAKRMAKWLVEKDGIFVGSSSAVNCVAAVQLARQMGPGKRIVTVLCDGGARHLSKFWKEVGNVGGDDGLTLEDVLAED